MHKSGWTETSSREAAAKLKKGEQLFVIDVREPSEWRSGHIPGARNIPLGQLPERLAELDPGRETMVVCLSGGRSTRACEYLSRMGYKVTNLKGGMSGWTGDVE